MGGLAIEHPTRHVGGEPPCLGTGVRADATGGRQVSIESGVEGLFEGRDLWVCGCQWFEVGHCNADGSDSGVGSDDDVVLARGTGEEIKTKVTTRARIRMVPMDERETECRREVGGVLFMLSMVDGQHECLVVGSLWRTFRVMGDRIE